MKPQSIKYVCVFVNFHIFWEGKCFLLHCYEKGITIVSILHYSTNTYCYLCLFLPSQLCY